jgi:poly-gamma-glutamate synthesis protein (capsule biosynthesis protein)
MASGVTRLSSAAGIGLVLGAVTFVAVLATLPPVPEIRAANEPPISFLSSVIRQWQSQGVDTKIVKAPRILFVGDMMFDRHVAERIKASGNSGYPFSKLDDLLIRYDFTVANLEGPVTDVRRDPVKTIDFAFDSDVAFTLWKEGVDAVSQANNHTLDQGVDGFDDSRSMLRGFGLLVFGHQVRDDEIAMATTTINDVRFAFLGFNTTDNPLDKVAAERVMKEARASNDRVVVFTHWGSEYKNEPDPAVVDLAHWFIDHGADAVIGGHPHWTQGIASYKGHPIAYSLGNFIFDQDFSVETRQGLAVALTFRDNEIALEPIPIQIDASQPHAVEGEERVARLKALAEISDATLREQILQGSIVF